MIAALLLGLAACAPASEGGETSRVETQKAVAPATPTAGLQTRNGRYLVDWTPVPAPIPTSELFEVRVTLRDAKTGAVLPDAKVHVDARMPQHGHGMATRPVDDPGVCTGSGDAMTCTHPDGIYVTRGMKFHMPGEWTLTISVEGPSGHDQLDVRTTL